MSGMNVALIVVCALGSIVGAALFIEDREEAAEDAINYGDTVVIPYKALHKGKTTAWLKELVKKHRKLNKRYKGRHKRPWLFSQHVSVVR